MQFLELYTSITNVSGRYSPKAILLNNLFFRRQNAFIQIHKKTFRLQRMSLLLKSAITSSVIASCKIKGSDAHLRECIDGHVWYRKWCISFEYYRQHRRESIDGHVWFWYFFHGQRTIRINILHHCSVFHVWFWYFIISRTFKAWPHKIPVLPNSPQLHVLVCSKGSPKYLYSFSKVQFSSSLPIATK